MENGNKSTPGDNLIEHNIINKSCAELIRSDLYRLRQQSVVKSLYIAILGVHYFAISMAQDNLCMEARQISQNVFCISVADL